MAEAIGIRSVSEIGKEIVKGSWLAVKYQVSYLVFYKKNVNKLSEHVEKLDLAMNDVQRGVDAALRNGQVVNKVVRAWLQKSDQMKNDASRMMAEVQENKRCFKGCCPNLASRYRLGKEVEEKVVVVDDLLRQWNNLITTVSQPPPPTGYGPMPLGDFKAFGKTNEAMKKVMDALKDESKCLIGIYGMGGVGKTTLMKEIGRLLSKQKEMFDIVIMVVVSQTPDVKKIQRDIAVQLGLKLTEENEYAASIKLAERLTQKNKLVEGLKKEKILIMLDDLWARLDLRQVGIPYGAEDEGCKILLTTRKLHVCNVMQCHSIQVNVLSDEDSWELFISTAEAVVNSPDLEPVAREVARECMGLPLAIVMLGRALRGSTQINHWEHALVQLRRSSPADLEGLEEVFNSIELSYTHLSGEGVKSLFLFCCLFPEDCELSENELTRYLMGEEFLTEYGSLKEKKDCVSFLVDKLIGSCLLLPGRQKGYVKMHDVVRDVAKYIASKDSDGFLPKASEGLSEWPKGRKWENRKRISLMNNDISTLPDQPKCNQLHTLLLRGNQNLSDIPNNFFKEMENLTVLDISGSNISLLPSSLSCLTNLKTLYLDNCKGLQDFSLIGQLEGLEVLSLRYCSFGFLPSGIGRLTNLKFLDLTCKYLMADSCFSIPANVMGELSHLEELYMIRCTSKEAAVIAENAPLESLVVLHARASAVTQMTLVMKGVSYISDSVKVLLRKTESLVLLQCNWGFNNLVDLDERGRFGKLKSVQLSRCDRIECLLNTTLEEVPPPIAFSNLEVLQLSLANLSGICLGPLPAHSFGKLRCLKISGCRKLVNIFPWELMERVQNSLEELRVDYCDVQEVFHFEGDEVGHPLMANLRSLNLRDLPNLTSIWRGVVPPGTFQNMERIAVYWCELLQEVFHFDEGHPGLPNLRTLCLQFSKNMTSLWSGVVPPGSLQNLEKLKLTNCRNLAHIFSTKLDSRSHFDSLPSGTFSNLKELELDGCGGLEYVFLPSLAHELRSLELLKIRRIDAVEKIIGEEDGVDLDKGTFPKLKILGLVEMLNLRSFYQGAAGATPVSLDWPSLVSVDLEGCPYLKRLPIGPTSAPKLKEVYLGGNDDDEWFKGLEWEDPSILSRFKITIRPTWKM